MTRPFDFPTRRAGAIAVAATLATLAGVAQAQSPQSSPLPGYAHSSDGRPLLSGFGACVRTSGWTPAIAAEPCDLVARVEAPAPVVTEAPKAEPVPPPVAAVAPVVAPEPPRPVIQKLTLSTDVLFDFNSAELKDTGKARLDQLVAEIKDADVDEIVAVGHADRIASEPYNQKLSEARAQAVKDYLASKGAKGNAITAQGKGESEPVTGQECAKMGPERGNNRKLVSCLQPDRRVEIEVLGSRQVAGGSPAPAAGSSGTPATGATR